jgi:hypothetical protein
VAANTERRRSVEIRSYLLKPGTSGAFDRLVTGSSVPMLCRRGIDVVAFGPSLQDKEAYFLIRAHASLEDLERSEAAFYGSDEWRHGRGAILACIEHYISVVIEMDDASVGVDGPAGIGQARGAALRLGRTRPNTSGPETSPSHMMSSRREAPVSKNGR